MKKVLNVGIGGRSFVIDEDAYQVLDNYLKKFRSRVQMGIDTKEVMNDLEDRIADIFVEKVPSGNVVSIEIVNSVIERLGMPDGEAFHFEGQASSVSEEKPVKKFYRDPDSKAIGGICAGLAHYLDADVVLIRLLFVLATVLSVSLGFWFYVIVWFVVPMAKTATQKCEMRGLPVTIENLRKFSNNR